MKRKKQIILVVVIIALLFVSAFVYLFVNKSGSKALENITVETQPLLSSALLYIAQNQSLFTKNGLNVTLNDGIKTIDDLVSNKCNFAVGTEFAVAGPILASANISTIAVVDKSETFYLLARKDSGVVSANDLIGKKIGVVSGSITNFYLDRYLSLNSIDATGVNTLIFQQPTPMINSLVNGSIDALVASTGIVLNTAQSQLGNNAVLLPIQFGQPTFASLVCQSNYLTANSDMIKSLLRALDDAATYIANNPSQAQQIIQNKLNITTISASDWQSNQFSLSLEQSLVIAMKDETQWTINNHLTNQTQVPNFADYIDTDGLKAVKPQSVSIIK